MVPFDLTEKLGAYAAHAGLLCKMMERAYSDGSVVELGLLLGSTSRQDTGGTGRGPWILPSDYQGQLGVREEAVVRGRRQGVFEEALLAWRGTKFH